MKKQLIAIGLVSFLAVPSVVFAEGDACAPIMSEGMTEEAVMAAKSAAMDTSECMGQRLGSIEEFSHGHGVSLYGSLRTGLSFGSGDTNVGDFTSRWGFQGSAEVSEGLTAAFRYEARMDTTSATSSGHRHTNFKAATDERDDGISGDTGECEAGDTENHDAVTEESKCKSLWKEDDSDFGGGRLSYISLSGGFGTVSLGQIWSASAIHYGFKVDPSYVNGVFGGASYRPGNTVSYSSSAGDVSFQIDKVTGTGEKTEFGASADLGPVGIGVGYWSNANDKKGFSGVALTAGAAGVNLTIGLGSTDDAAGKSSDTSILHINGSLGDSGISYAVQIANSDEVEGKESKDQNLIVLTNSIGSGASLIFEHLDPSGDADSSSLIGLKVDF